MKFAIQVNSGHSGHPAAWAGLRFATAAIAAGHQVLRVFFYQDGVYQAMRHISPPDDEANSSRAWSELAAKQGLDLVVCISAAQRRGLLCDDEARRQGLPEGIWLADGFRIAGLGQWLEATLQADRCITFA